MITYVAETKEKAEEEAVDHIRYFFEDALRTTPTFLAPPGYLSVDQLKKRAALADKLHGAFSFQNINESFFVAVGTADQVVEQLEGWAEKMGTNHFVIFGAIGNMPNMESREKPEFDRAGRHSTHARPCRRTAPRGR